MVIRIEKSVFAGVERDSLSFEDIKSVFYGKVITKHIPIRFFKSLRGLSIRISSTKITISKQSDKQLINNNYIPITINNSKIIDKLSRFKGYIVKMLHYLKR